MLPAIVAGISSGILAGICTVLLVSRSAPARSAPTSEARQMEMRPAQPREEPRAWSTPTPSEARQAAAARSPSKPEDHEPPADDVEAAQRFEKRVDSHRAEPVVAEWSKATSSSLAKDLGGLGESGSFEVIEVDCRRTTCTAELEWPSYADANADVTRILAKAYEVNCGMGLSIPEPRDRNVPYRATVLFDCQDGAEVN